MIGIRHLLSGRRAALRETLAHIGGQLAYNDFLLQLSTRYARAYYKRETHRLWSKHDEPEWFDHRADVYRFSELRNPCWAERGIYARELMEPGCRVLDLCCGDGFYAFHFYSEVADHVDACDVDPTAIAHAESWHSHPGITYVRRDIVADPFPDSSYDVIVWDAAIDRFSLDDIDTILGKVDVALKPNGVLCGYTIVNTGDRKHSYHQQDFGSAVDVANVLRRKFSSVVTLETDYPDRHNIYFRSGRTLQSFRGFGNPLATDRAASEEAHAPI